MITGNQVQALLTLRGKTGAPLVDFILTDNSDGAGARITTWNVATLGPLPTQAEIEAITPAQATAAVSSQRLAQFKLTSRGKDALASCALSVRTRGIPAWNAMTTQQKKDAVLAEADIWTNLRDFIETNL